MGLSPERLARLAIMEEGHFWFAGRRALVNRELRRFLGSAPCWVADVGCGTGSLVAELAGRGYRVIGLDARPEGMQAHRPTAVGAAFAQGDTSALPFAAGRFDAATMLDVLEHVDDVAALREVRRVLRPGGILLLTVPAFPWLWSHRDDAAGHRRRYTPHSLRRVLAEGGFAVRDLRFYQFFLFPAIVVARALGRGGPQMRDREDASSALLNPLLAALNRLEVALGQVVRWPWGSSLVAVGQRRWSADDAPRARLHSPWEDMCSPRALAPCVCKTP